jgi:pyruvate, water dikinase
MTTKTTTVQSPRRKPRTTWGLLWALLTLGALGACGAGSEGDGVAGIRVELTGAATPSPSHDMACVVAIEGTVERRATPIRGTARAFRCELPEGTTTGERLRVTVKARGAAWETHDLDLEGSGDEEPRITISLRPLGTAELSDDYATGFSAASGAEDFSSLGIGFPTALGPSEVVKFIIVDVQGEPQVYFQDTQGHPLHYPFARDVLGLSMSLKDFEDATYEGEERANIAGTLIGYPDLDVAIADSEERLTAPTAVTFFPSDDLTPQQAAQAYRWLAERMDMLSLTEMDRRLVYLPAGEAQASAALEEAEVFAEIDALCMSHAELHGGADLQILNPGLAYGTLRLVDEDASVDLVDQILSHRDILVLPRLPLELPLVGGTITQEQQTPLAHVNVAARTRGTPNISLAGASEDPRVAPFIDKLVRFEVAEGRFSLEETSLAEAEAFWAARIPEPFSPGADLDFDELAGFESLGFADSARVGAKAANLAELHHLIPEHAPTGFAVPFAAYEAFMAGVQVDLVSCEGAAEDCVDEGRLEAVCDAALALCAASGGGESANEHLARLLGDPGFQADSALREAALNSLRWIMRNTAVDEALAADLNARVAEVFGDAKVRLRSSTNAEDLEGFSGAGLYDSVSAYAEGEKLASDRVRRVWASVWSWRAFEERAWWGIDHAAIHMGVAVTRSYPDEEANGVLITQNIADPTVAGMYVNVQLGEVSVTNPTEGALPEVFSIIPGPEGIQAARQRFSSLSPDEAILSTSELWTLFRAATQVQEHFAPLYGANPVVFPLEIEFKIDDPERTLYIKQARPYSVASW